MKIKKAKLGKRGTVEVAYVDDEGNEIMIKGKNRCHNDMKVAFARLVPFFADLTEQKEADNIDWDNLESEENRELLQKLDVTGLSIGGDALNPFITLTGRRTLYSSKVLNLNAPGVDINSEATEWDHVEDFDVAVDGVIYEVKEYLTNQKWEVVEQTINFEANPEDSFAEADVPEDVPSVEEPAEVA